MLSLDRVELSLGERHWQFSLDLDTHGVYALLGRSGSGKSSFLNLIAGFVTPSAGTLSWCGESFAGTAPADRPVTTLFQDNNLFTHLSVYKNLGLGLSPTLRLSDAESDAIHTVLEQVGLAGYAQKLPGELSGGEKQRVALGRCLLRRQPLLLLDEPFSALDATTRQEMISLLNEVVRAFNPCVVMVTHDANDAKAIGAKTIQMTQTGVAFE